MSRTTLLVAVKAYPVLDGVSSQEAVCVAGVTAGDTQRRWVRLFPIDFRALPLADRFHKYDVIELEAPKSKLDHRPESHAPTRGSLRVTGDHLDTDRGTWARRLEYFDPLMDESMCQVQREQRKSGRSIGIFRPAEVFDLTLEPQTREFTDRQRALLHQGSLLSGGWTADTRTALEPLPVKAKYRYRCSDAACKGDHHQSLIDWELGALYRRLESEGDDRETIYSKLRLQFLERQTAEGRDLRFIVGSMLSHPASFLVLGLVSFKPKKAPPEAPLSLF